MSKTLSTILSEIGAYVDQDTALPTSGSTEESTRVSFVNQALQEWENSYDWAQLHIQGTISVGLSGTSAALPSNFKKLLSPIYDVSQPVTTDREYIEVPANERLSRQRTDKVVWVGGDDSQGYYVGSFGFVSGFSGVFDYQSKVSSLATLADVAAIPNPNFLVKRSVAYILEARSDTRFPEVKVDADRELRRMIEFEDTPSGAENNRIPDWPRSTGFVIGED